MNLVRQWIRKFPEAARRTITDALQSAGPARFSSRMSSWQDIKEAIESWDSLVMVQRLLPQQTA